MTPEINSSDMTCRGYKHYPDLGDPQGRYVFKRMKFIWFDLIFKPGDSELSLRIQQIFIVFLFSRALSVGRNKLLSDHHPHVFL